MLIQLSLIHDQVKNLIASMIYIVVYQQEREKPIMAQGGNTSCMWREFRFHFHRTHIWKGTICFKCLVLDMWLVTQRISWWERERDAYLCERENGYKLSLTHLLLHWLPQSLF